MLRSNNKLELLDDYDTLENREHPEAEGGDIDQFYNKLLED